MGRPGVTKAELDLGYDLPLHLRRCWRLGLGHEDLGLRDSPNSGDYTLLIIQNERSEYQI